MSLWVDKVRSRNRKQNSRQYRPRTLDDLSYHEELASRLRSLVSFTAPLLKLTSGGFG